MYEKIKTFPKEFPSVVTALPASADNGDQIILVDSLTAPTYSWLLQYVAAKSSNKWVFIGGSAAFNDQSNYETISTTGTFSTGSTGPSFTVPVTGIYALRAEAQIVNSSAGAAVGYIALVVSGTQVDTSLAGFTVVAGGLAAPVVESLNTSLTASSVVKLGLYSPVQPWVFGGDNSIQRMRCIRALPVALGG